MLDFFEIINNFGVHYGGVLALLGVAGVFIALISFVYRDNIEIRYVITSSGLIHDHKKEYEKLEIKYDGTEISNLTVTRILIYNPGKVPIRDTDLPEDGKLTVLFGAEVDIFDAKIIQEISDGCNFSLDISKNKCRVKFHHINPQNAVLIHILHTGLVKPKPTLLAKGAGLKAPIESDIGDQPIVNTLFITLMCAFIWYSAFGSTTLTALIVFSALGSLPLLLLYYFIPQVPALIWLRKIIKEME